jgi:hypothetical protein
MKLDDAERASEPELGKFKPRGTRNRGCDTYMTRLQNGECFRRAPLPVVVAVLAQDALGNALPAPSSPHEHD